MDDSTVSSLTGDSEPNAPIEMIPLNIEPDLHVTDEEEVKPSKVSERSRRILENAVVYLEYFNRNVTNVDQFNHEFSQALKNGSVIIPCDASSESKTTASKAAGKRTRDPTKAAVPRGPRPKRPAKKVQEDEGESPPFRTSPPDDALQVTATFSSSDDHVEQYQELPFGETETPEISNEEEADTSDAPKLVIDV